MIKRYRLAIAFGNNEYAATTADHAEGEYVKYEDIKHLLSQSEGWRPIETAPKDGTPILVCNDTTMAAVYWWPAVWMGTTHCGMKEPTRWMPLPPLPNKEMD